MRNITCTATPFIRAIKDSGVIIFPSKVSCTSLFRGFTALHKSSQGHLDICRFLVEQKADVNAGISYDARPHTLTRIRWRISGFASIVFTFSLFRSHKKHTPLHLSSHGGHLDICQFLVEHKADVHAQDDEYNSPSL